MRKLPEFLLRAEQSSFRFLAVLDVLHNADDLSRPPRLLGDDGRRCADPDGLSTPADIALFYHEVLDVPREQLLVKLSILPDIVRVRQFEEIFTLKFLSGIADDLAVCGIEVKKPARRIGKHKPNGGMRESTPEAVLALS